MPSALKASEYQALLDQIDAIYTRAQKEGSRALNLILTRAYWEIGKRIVTVEQKNNLRAQYGEALLEQISQYLTQKYGTGFSETNLGYMRQFYIAYPIPQTSGELEWSHYQLLSTVQDKDERQAYERKAVKEKWSVRELNTRLRAAGVKRVSLPDAPIYINSRKTSGVGTPTEALAERRSNQLSPKLNAQRGTLYTYRLAEAATPLLEGSVFVDCGFRLWYPVSCALKSLTKDTIVETVVSGDSFEAVKSGRGEKDLYTYLARVTRVVDADTLWAEIDLGLGGVTLQKLRLRGVDAPEIDTAAGARAKRFAEKLLKPCPFVIVKTYKDQSDKYDRYLVDVYFKAGETDPAVVAATGEYLNQRLLDEGLAVRYEG